MRVGRQHRLHEGVTRALALVTALLLAACGGQSDPEQERQTLASWGAAVGMAVEQWSNGALPTHFVHHLLASAQQAFDEERQPISQITSRAARAELLAGLDSLHTAAVALQQQVDRREMRSARDEAALALRIAMHLRQASHNSGNQ